MQRNEVLRLTRAVPTLLGITGGRKSHGNSNRTMEGGSRTILQTPILVVAAKVFAPCALQPGQAPGGSQSSILRSRRKSSMANFSAFDKRVYLQGPHS